MIKLVQINKHSTNDYRLSNIYLNPKYIVFISEHIEMKQDLREGKIKLGIDPSADFTKIKMNESNNLSEIIVVGSPEMIENKIASIERKKLLKG